MGARGAPASRIEAKLERGGWLVECLRPLAGLYALVTRLRNALYDRRVLRAHRVDAPVVCVGNLTAGGTGKTPMVALVVESLRERGRRVAVLSRGSRGDASTDGPTGDEARMLARRFPDLVSVQDSDRVRGAWRLASSGCDAIVLDDGFQHRRLARDVDLVLVDATRPFGAPWRGDVAPEHVLPRGLLREPASGLARASACVVTRSDMVSPERLTILLERVGELAPGLPVLLAEHRPTGLVDREGTRWPLARLVDRDVDLVSGIGNPDAFEATVRGLGAKVQEHRRFADHHAYTDADVRGLGRGGRAVVTTAKDAVKLEDLLPALLVLEVELVITRGHPVLDALLDSIGRSGSRLRRDNLHEGLHG
ncbi:MAG: tetraacyldisaccharide 4'-kinase [Planctomycetota bacterium]